MIPSSGQNGLSRFESLSTRRALADLRSDRLALAPHLLGLPCPRAAPGRPARGAGRRASTRRTRPRRRARGSTQMTSPLRTRGIFGTSANGELVALERVAAARAAGRSRASLKPVPTLPAQRSPPSSLTREHERAEAPARRPWPFVQPAITNSWRPCVFTFSHSRRAPARRVERVGPLGHDPLEPLLLRGLEERLAVLERSESRTVRSRRRAARRAARAARSAAGRRAARRRPRARRSDVDDERARRPAASRRSSRGPVVERAHLAVEDAVGRADAPARAPARRRRSARSGRCRSGCASVDARRREVDDRAVAVPLHLVQPAVAASGPSSASVASIGA